MLLLTLPVKTACEEQLDNIMVQFLIQVFQAEYQIHFHPTEVMGKVYTQAIL